MSGFIGLSQKRNGLINQFTSLGIDDNATSNAVTIDGSENVTITDGAHDFDVASHDGTNGLKLGGTLVEASATELNIIDGLNATTTELNTAADGDTSPGTTAVAGSDGFVTNDAGTMRQTTVDTLDTYLAATSKTLTNKTITNPSGMDKNDVGLGNVDNTADASQTAFGTVTSGTLGGAGQTFPLSNMAFDGQMTFASGLNQTTSEEFILAAGRLWLFAVHRHDHNMNCFYTFATQGTSCDPGLGKLSSSITVTVVSGSDSTHKKVNISSEAGLGQGDYTFTFVMWRIR